MAMFTRTRYKQGCLAKEKRSHGPAVWIFRWRELNRDGKRINRKVVLGTVEEYPTQSAAEKAIAGLRLEINKETPRQFLQPLTVEQLVAHYREKELAEDDTRKAYSTREAYRCYLANWIVPRWGSYLLGDVKTVAVEDWLGTLPLANGTKAKLRNLMSALFNHAMRYEWWDRNPISLVRQSAKRERIPDILDVEEIKALLEALDEPFRTMVFVAMCTGLRASELFALQWADIDFEVLEIKLRRGIVHQVVGPLKTEASSKPIPLDADLAEVLRQWKGRSGFTGPNDWVFASSAKGGTQPLWSDSALKRVRTGAKKCGIAKTVGWHTFRRTFATLLKANGEDVKVVQEAMRHANSRITLDIYAQAVTPAKRQAQGKVVQMIRTA